MSEIIMTMVENMKDIVLYIPRKVIMHFDNYKFLEEKYKEYQATKRAYERRLNCIRITAEQNHYGDESNYKRKIIELATTPIGISSINKIN